jgi:hypothetical protein
VRNDDENVRDDAKDVMAESGRNGAAFRCFAITGSASCQQSVIDPKMEISMKRLILASMAAAALTLGAAGASFAATTSTGNSTQPGIHAVHGTMVAEDSGDNSTAKPDSGDNSGDNGK